jgi:dihydroorotase
MGIRAEILKEHSKQNAEAITQWVSASRQRVGQLMELFLHDEYRVVQRLAQVVGKLADTHPQLIAPHLPQLVQRMNEAGVHVAVKRNVVRTLQYVDIPEALHGEVMNTCFDLLADPNETVAVRAFAMSVLDKLSTQYPEIRQELKVIIEDVLEQGCTAAFRARARMVLKGK